MTQLLFLLVIRMSLFRTEFQHQCISITGTDRHLLASDGDRERFDLLNLIDRDDVALMYSDKLIGWQLLLEVLEAVESRNTLGTSVKRYVLVLPLNVEQVIEIDLIETVVGLDEHEGTLSGLLRSLYDRWLMSCRSCFEALELGDGLLNGSGEAREGDRLEQVVDGRDFVALKRVFRVGGSEDDGRNIAQCASQFDAVEIGHVDIEQQDVYLLLIDNREGLGRVLCGAKEIEIWEFGDVALQELAGKELVIDDQDVVHS